MTTNEEIIEKVLKETESKFKEMLIKDFGEEEASEMTTNDKNFKILISFAIEKTLALAEENSKVILKKDGEGVITADVYGLFELYKMQIKELAEKDKDIEKLKSDFAEKIEKLRKKSCLDKGSGICFGTFGEKSNVCNSCKNINEIFSEEIAELEKEKGK